MRDVRHTRTFKPTHRMVAQAVRIVDQEGCLYHVEHSDGSRGWVTGPLVPIKIIKRKALA